MQENAAGSSGLLRCNVCNASRPLLSRAGEEGEGEKEEGGIFPGTQDRARAPRSTVKYSSSSSRSLSLSLCLPAPSGRFSLLFVFHSSSRIKIL